MSIVFDSSAMLAFLRDEKGADVVETHLRSGAPCYAHAVNLCEVFYDVLHASDATRAKSEIALLVAAGIEERKDIDGLLWRDMAALVVTYRSGKGNRLVLDDAFGVALARRLDASFVTADRGELETVTADNAAKIVFIR